MLILANKQDLPGAKEPRELEKLLGLYELTPAAPISGSAIPSSATTSSATTPSSESIGGGGKEKEGMANHQHHQQFKGWFIQPACAITGEGLQEGLDALYEMIQRRRKITKANKKKIR